MRKLCRASFAGLFALAWATAVHGQAAIVGVVFDSTTRSPVVGALITVPGTSYSALTTEQGEFQLRDLRAGTVTLRVSHLAYGERTLSVDLTGDAPTYVRLALSRSAILLEAIEVDVLSNEDRAQRALGTRRSLVTRDQIASLESGNATLADVVRQYIPNVRIRRQERISGAPICLELRTIRATVNQNECLSPAVYLDGIPIGNPTSLYGSLNIEMIESVEVVPASEAGVRYGTNALYGALLIETRRPGRGLAPPVVRGLRTYDWAADTRNHPASKAFGYSFAGNIVGLALGYAAWHRCLGLREPAKDAIITTCNTWPTVGAAIAALTFPSIGGALGARLGGQTDRSRGLLVPATVGALMAVVPGYALALTSERGDSEILAVVSAGLLTVVVPFATTLADRLFRSARN